MKKHEGCEPWYPGALHGGEVGEQAANGMR